MNLSLPTISAPVPAATVSPAVKMIGRNSAVVLRAATFGRSPMANRSRNPVRKKMQ